MKKLLLTIAVALLSVTAINAQVLGTTEWNKTLTTVAAAEDATNGVMAIDDNGNLFVSGALTTTATFGSTSLEPIGLAQYIVKYNAIGAEQWATAIQGPATITAMDTDAEGNLYVAGTYTSEIMVYDADAVTYEELTEGEMNMLGDYAVSAFIVKYNASGTLEYVRSVQPTTNADIAASYSYYGSPYFKINKIVAENGKLYASAIYAGDVYVGTDLTLKGRYNFVGFFMYVDLPSAVVFSLDAEGMDNPALVANMRSKEDITSDMQYAVNTVNFAVDGNDVYAAFQGYGDFIVETATSSEQVTFAVDGAGSNEHGAVIVKSGATTSIKKFSNVATDITTDSYDIISAMEVVEQNIYLAGTYSAYNPFDNTLSTLNEGIQKSTSDIYVASIAKSNLTTNWVVSTPDKNDQVNQEYEDLVGAMIYPNEVRMVTAVKKVSGNAVVSTSNQLVSFAGEVSVLNTEQATALAYNGDNAAYILNNSTSSALYYGTIPVNELAGIEESVVDGTSNITYANGMYIFTEAVDAQIYDVQGRCVKAVKAATEIATEGLNKGVYILKAGSEVVKFVK